MRVGGGEVVGRCSRWVMGIQRTCCSEHWVLSVSDTSLNSIPETNIALVTKISIK